MSEFTEQLEAAFEHTDYDVVEVSRNRNRVRVAVLPEGADPGALRAVIEEAIGEDGILGYTVSTETVDANDTFGTVASFQYRD